MLMFLDTLFGALLNQMLKRDGIKEEYIFLIFLVSTCRQLGDSVSEIHDVSCRGKNIILNSIKQ